MKNEWDVDAAIATYNVDGWGSGYFTINAEGNVIAKPLQENGGSINILEVVSEARTRGLSFPLVIRFQDLLRHRVESVNLAFQNAIAEYDYKGQYRGVFPIKVNQLREVIEEIVDAGQQFHFGLEAGSKPELVAALAMHKDSESLIICNGYKDKAFIRIALLGRKLGKLVIIVVEKLEELDEAIKEAKEVGVEPMIGIRVRLHSKSSGKWSPSSGENAKFGLDTTNLVAASQMLKEAGMAHCLKLIHFHVGSQVPDISTIKRAVREGARYYAKLSKLGHDLGYLDVGGGLGVDYDGSGSDFDSSANYSLQEYANDVVWNIMDVCDSEGVPHPAIVNEGGRAIVAHHSVLVMEAFSSIEKTVPRLKIEATEKDHKLVGDILDVKQRLKRGNRMESLHDIQQIKEEAQETFNLGLLDLESKAKIDAIYWQLAQQIVNMSRGLRFIPDEVKELETALGDQYICNFSVFQSLLDHWALGQLFPIMPIHRLTSPPDRQGTIVAISASCSCSLLPNYSRRGNRLDFIPSEARSEGRLLLHKLMQSHGAHARRINVAFGVGAHSFRKRDLRIRRCVRNERFHGAILRAADADAALHPRISRLVRLGVHRIQSVVFGNKDSAGAAELAPLSDEVSVLIEDLNAAVAAIGDEKPTLGIHRQPVQRIEFARP